MIQEAYCSFEIAKLLKEKGFDEICYRLYNTQEKELWGTDGIEFQNHYLDEESITAPTHQMALAWLRETKDIYIAILHGHGITPSYWFNWSTGDKSGFYDSDGFYMTYEEATEAAIKYALEVLI